MRDTIEQLLPAALIDNGYSFSSTTQQQLIQYLHLLTRWNQVFNLTAIHEASDMVYLHILDSLSISPYLQGNFSIDIGTGAGLPGIPLALAHPDKRFVLLDSNSKKTRFLIQVIHELGIKNAEVVHARCEDFHHEARFDNIISRAFSSIAVMLANTQHLLSRDGQFLAMKGVYPAQEIEEMPTGFVLQGVHQLVIRGLAVERHVVCIRRKQEGC